jgi:hypothetical protein
VRIDWMGMTTGRVKMPRIVWTCDCGHQNFASGRFSRTLVCDVAAGCGRMFEVEISPMPDRQLEEPPARRERRQGERDEPGIEF